MSKDYTKLGAIVRRITVAAEWWRETFSGYLDWRGERVFVFLTIAATVAGLWFYRDRIESLAPFAYGVAKVATFVVTVRYMDTLFLRWADTRYEITEKQNVAYAILYGAFALGIGIVLGNI